MNGRLISTRDKEANQVEYSFALLKGLADDKGLFVPVDYPEVSLDELRSFRELSYPELSFEIKRRLVGGSIPDRDLELLLQNAYSKDKFNISNGQVTPVRHLHKNVFIQNLSTGPTAAFKDMALQPLGQEINYELERRNEHLVFLGATSGDTGSSAEAAMKGLQRVILFMLSPQRGMSDFQKAQMGALTGGNIFNIGIDGSFDDCQELVKLFKYGAVNSINWGRISSQVPYYFSGYLQAVENVGEVVDFVVPSGNFGNVYSGYVAKMMGLPIRRLIIATNENNVLERLVNTGVYAATPSRITTSPSMDISKASNYERLAFDLLGRDPEKLAKYMQEFNQTGKVDFRDFGLTPKIFEDNGFFAGSSSHSQRLETIRRVCELNGTIIDPHTADGVNVALNQYWRNEPVPMIVMETALPVKFEPTIKEALGFVPEREERFKDLESRSSGGFYNIPADPALLKEYIQKNS